VTIAPGAPSVIIAPAQNAQWIFGQHNTIQWNEAANITGAIYLADAATGKTIGWILQETGPNQTSFSWNTRDLLLSRTSPSGITVSAGTYVVKVMFDSPQDPTLTSAPFSIIYPNQAQIPTHDANIANGVFSPTTLTVTRGDKIVLTNQDAQAYQILISSFSPFPVPAGGSYTLDTTPLSPGPYVFYSSSNPTLRMTATVQ
jgi:plastocyanin